MNPPTRRRTGFTLIELLVVIAIIAILAAILFPVFAKAREKARQSSCQSNMKQVMLGIIQYKQDYDQYMTRPWQRYNDSNGWIWLDTLDPYIRNDQVADCPSTSRKPWRYTTLNSAYSYNWDRTRMDYACNTSYWSGRAGNASGPIAVHPMGRSDGDVQDSAQTVVLLDYTGYFEAPGQYDVSYNLLNGNRVMERHNDGIDIAFYDGHVKWQRRSDLIITHTWFGVPIKYYFTIDND